MAQPKRRRTTTSRRKPEGKGSNIWFVLTMLLLLLGGLFYFKEEVVSIKESIIPTVVAVEQVEVQGNDADYRKRAASVRRAVESYLTDGRGSVEGLESQEKEDSRAATGGKIRWDVKTIVYQPNDDFSPAKLKERLKFDTIKINVAEAGTVDYKGEKVPQFTVIVEDELDGQSVAMIVERIYVLPQKAKAEPLKEMAKKIGLGEEKKEPPKQITPQAPKAQSPGKAKLALVIDDFGYNYDIIGRYNAMPIPLTYAVLPYKEHSIAAAEGGYQAGKHIILHLPMESMGDVGAEPTTIRTSMSEEEIKQIARRAIDATPHIRGVNNHQGSRATADSRVMEATLSVLRSHSLFFIDSHTNGATVAMQTARAMGIASGINELFIDNESDIDYIEGQLAQAARMALNSGGGYVIAIGHARPNTATAIERMIPKLQAQGIEFVFAQSLLY